MSEHSSSSVPSVLYDEQYFLNVCEGYEEFRSSEGTYLSQRLAEALSVAGIADGMQVLDVGCGRGEVVRRVSQLGAHAYGIDYAAVAVRISHQVAQQTPDGELPVGVYQASALNLPYGPGTFDRILMLDIVEHLYPEELALAIREAFRVLKPGGRIVIHTAPNVWYDRYAYPVVRLVRVLMGQGARYPQDPREIIPENLYVHVNEQSAMSLWRLLRRHGYRSVRAWLSTPPQNRREGWLFRFARWVLFELPPFRWFFQREVFAVGEK